MIVTYFMILYFWLLLITTFDSYQYETYFHRISQIYQENWKFYIVTVGITQFPPPSKYFLFYLATQPNVIHILTVVYVKATLQWHLLTPSYKCVTANFTLRFISINLKIRINWRLIQFWGKIIIYTTTKAFYYILIWKRSMSLLKLQSLSITQVLTIVLLFYIILYVIVQLNFSMYKIMF